MWYCLVKGAVGLSHCDDDMDNDTYWSNKTEYGKVCMVKWVVDLIIVMMTHSGLSTCALLCDITISVSQYQWRLV